MSVVAKFSHYIDLTDEERRFLVEAEREPTAVRRGATVSQSGEKLETIYVLKSGWLVAHTSDAAGAELIVEVYHPGDIVGVSQLGCEVCTLTFAAATDIELCPIRMEAIGPMFSNFPRLAALLFGFVALERASMVDRLRAMGRMSARDCVALFLLQTRARLRLTSGVDAATEQFLMPLSQEVIGNVVGLSTVSVNRAIRLLEDQGHLEREGRRMRLLHVSALANEVEFVDRVYRIDRSWLPASGGKRGARIEG